MARLPVRTLSRRAPPCVVCQPATSQFSFGLWRVLQSLWINHHDAELARMRQGITLIDSRCVTRRCCRSLFLVLLVSSFVSVGMRSEVLPLLCLPAVSLCSSRPMPYSRSIVCCVAQKREARDSAEELRRSVRAPSCFFAAALACVDLAIVSVAVVPACVAGSEATASLSGTMRAAVLLLMRHTGLHLSGRTQPTRVLGLLRSRLCSVRPLSLMHA